MDRPHKGIKRSKTKKADIKREFVKGDWQKIDPIQAKRGLRQGLNRPKKVHFNTLL